MNAWRRWAFNAERLFEVPSPESLSVPLLGVRAGELHLGVTEDSSLERAVVLEPSAQRALDGALSAADHLVPGAAGSDVALGFRRVAELGIGGALSTVAIQRYEGASFGASFGLAVLARRLGQAIDDTVYASATLGPDGALGAVEGLEVKLAGLARLTAGGPSVTLIVAAEQFEVACALAVPFPGISVASARTLAAAAELAFGSADFDGLLLDRIDESEREAMAMRWFRDVVGRRSLWQWGALRRFLGRAREQWTLPEIPGVALSLARDIAWRNEANARGTDLTFDAVLRLLNAIPMSVRLQCMAQLVQQSTDTDAWPHAWALDIAERYRDRSVRDLHGDELALAGAVGRWWGTAGAPEVGCRLALGLAEVHAELDDLAEMSRPLCEALRLAGATGDISYWDRANHLATRAQRADPITRAWIALSAGRGAWWLGRPEAARAWLESIDPMAVTNPRLGPELRALIGRYRAHCGLTAPEALTEQAFIEAVGQRDAAITLAIYGLERVGGADDPTSVLANLRALDPAVILRLERAWKERQPAMELAEWVARYYPY